MTRLPPQPDDNLDQAAASILHSEVPARSTVRAVNEPVDLCPHSGIGAPMPDGRPGRIARWQTAEADTENIRRKLQVRSRAQIAAWVTGQRLHR